MTWGEFKKKMEQEGVVDTDSIWYIDIGLDSNIEVERHPTLGVAVS